MTIRSCATTPRGCAGRFDVSAQLGALERKISSRS